MFVCFFISPVCFVVVVVVVDISALVVCALLTPSGRLEDWYEGFRVCYVVIAFVIIVTKITARTIIYFLPEKNSTVRSKIGVGYRMYGRAIPDLHQEPIFGSSPTTARALKRVQFERVFKYHG